MSSTSTTQRDFLSFGLEMEMFLRPRPHTLEALEEEGWASDVKPTDNGGQDSKQKRANREYMRQHIVTKLGDDERIAASQSAEGYTEWTITDEASLVEFGEYWRIEIVSRTMSTVGNWQSEIDAIFRILHAGWEIRLTTGCSMHVHVSPGTRVEDRYAVDEVRKVLKGIAYYDKAITKVMPHDRKANPWAMSSFAPPDCAPAAAVKKLAKLKQDYDQVPTQSWQLLYQRFDKIKLSQMVHMDLMGNERHLSWNFSHLSSQCGTVEFRRPPGVQSAVEAKKWVGVALGFVRQALATDWAAYSRARNHASVEEFGKFVEKGIAALGTTCLNSVGNGALKEDTSPPKVFSHAELRRIEEKKAKKEGKTSPFVVKANSRPNTPV